MPLLTNNVRMKQRADTAAAWTAENPVMLSGEIGLETDTRKFKIGDGVTAWSGLTYYGVPNVTVGPDEPTSPSLNDLWVDTN